MTELLLEIKTLDFDKTIFPQLESLPEAQNLWPIVYILNDIAVQRAYVGETTDMLARISAHLNNSTKNKLSEAHFIISSYFNKSATLDIESNLIKYIAADGQYQLLNGNIGLANHNYYEKHRYWELFQDIWNQLRGMGIAKHPIEYIDNSDLFKYSPYKSLTEDQKQGLISMLQMLVNSSKRNIVLEGGAGTGKTVLALFLFKLLHTSFEEFNFTEFGEKEKEILGLTNTVKEKYPNLKMVLVVPMTSFRGTLKRVFKNVKGLKAEMVVGPSDIAKNRFDIIVVDEAHRLRRRQSIVNYRSFDAASQQLGFNKDQHTELDWILKQSNKAIFFYDEDQSIKPADIPKEQFISLKSRPDTIVMPLISQLRVKGGKDYVDFVDRLLRTQLPAEYGIFHSRKYTLQLVNSIDQLIQQVKLHEKETGLSRMIAGFSWPWKSKKNHEQSDIEIDGKWLKWNVTNSDWINSPNAVDEVGCIHTTQGYDLNFTGIIFGKEISYDESTNEIIVLKQNYHDSNGKRGVRDDAELKAYIIDIYKTLMLRAIQGCYVHVVDKNLRAYFAKHIEPYRRPQSKVPESIKNPSHNNALQVPLYNLETVEEIFSNEEQVNYAETVPLPSKYKTTDALFACTATDESMNRVIPKGAICLFKRESGESINGKIILAELTDIHGMGLNSYYTIKEYHSVIEMSEEGKQQISIILKSLTHTEGNTDIKLTGEEVKKFRIIGIFERLL